MSWRSIKYFPSNVYEVDWERRRRGVSINGLKCFAQSFIKTISFRGFIPNFLQGLWTEYAEGRWKRGKFTFHLIDYQYVTGSIGDFASLSGGTKYFGSKAYQGSLTFLQVANI